MQKAKPRRSLRASVGEQKVAAHRRKPKPTPQRRTMIYIHELNHRNESVDNLHGCVFLVRRGEDFDEILPPRAKSTWVWRDLCREDVRGGYSSCAAAMEAFCKRIGLPTG